MFHHTPESFPWGKDAVHFLNVINGTLLLHCEDQSMLRLCLSCLLGAIRKFTHLFPREGYAHIIPTILRVYAAHSAYNFVVKSVEVSEKVREFALVIRVSNLEFVSDHNVSDCYLILLLFVCSIFGWNVMLLMDVNFYWRLVLSWLIVQ